MKFKKIVVLEPKPYLNKKELEKFADSVEFYDVPVKSDDEIINRLKKADAAILAYTHVTKVIEKLPDLKYIGLDSTDYSFLDIDALKKYSIALTNVIDYAVNSVAELVFAQLLRFYKKLDVVKNWQDRFSYFGTNLNNKSIGIIGFGRIGRKIAEIAKAFGMTVCYYSRHQKETWAEYCDLDQLLTKSDVIVVSCNFNEDTRFLLNKAKLEKVKKQSVIVNIARANIIDYEALAEKLNNDEISVAILDVLPDEPPTGNESILKAKNVLLTPHIGWKTDEAIRVVNQEVIENIKCFLKGIQKNRIV